MGLIGENGAGKSTTINAILNLISKDGGEIKLFGKVMSDNNKDIKEDIGIVYDYMNFYETLTLKQISKIMEKAYKRWDNELYLNYLKKFKLPIDKEIKAFSKGMKMKASIAIALSHHPKLLILDEATSGLDPIVRDEILDIFLDFVQDEKHSILISSHITSDLEKIADYITFIRNGEVIFSKDKDDLIYNYAIICSMMVITTFSFDNISTWNKYAVIMPISRKDVVISKYIMLFIFSIFGMIAGFFISTVIGVFFRNFIIKEVMLESIVSLFISMFLGSIIIPLLYKYGVEKARFLIIICFVIPSFLFSWIVNFINKLNIKIPTGFNLNILFACLPILAIAFIILSINISYKIFKKQELN